MCFDFLSYIYNRETILPKADDYYLKWINNDYCLEIAPQVYSIFQQQGRLSETPSFFQKKIKEKFKETLYQNLFIQNQTNSILYKLEEWKIEVIPLKGVIFSERYFGHIGARPTTDIDLLIKKKDLLNSIQCIKELGFHIEEAEINGHFHSSFSKELPGSPIPLSVELHWDILPENNSKLDIMEFWADAKSVKPNSFVKELSEIDFFYMICLHSWRHNLDSLKYYLDIVHLISTIGERIDYSFLMKKAAKDKTLKRLIRTLSIVYQECSFLEKIKPFPYKKETTYISFEEKIGKKAGRLKRYMDYIDYQLFSYDHLSYTLKETIKMVKQSSARTKSSIQK